MEVCDALLAFCDRATSITKTIGGSLKSEPVDLTPYVNNLTRMRENRSSSSELSLKDLAQDLSALVTIKLGSHLSTPDAQYWIAITTAFSAATRTVLPALSELVADTQSQIIEREAQSTIRYKERYN
jgi:cytidylate kinase